MKLFLLKILLQRRARDEGFTLPMVIAFGLVMLLLGTINIVKSSEENLIAINTNSSSDALAIAEVGVARYREFLNQNRILTIYNHAQWNTLAGQTCNDITTTPPGWEDGGTADEPNDTSKWWEIEEDRDNDGTDETIGEYRLVSYIYDNDGNTATTDNSDFSVVSDVNINDDNDPPIPPSGVAVNSITDENDTDDDGESDAVGILTIQGRSTDDSEAQIQVDIPLRVNDLDNFSPLLWVGSGSIPNFGGSGNLNLQNGNIILSNSGGGCPSATPIDGEDVINDPRDIPSIIGDPTSIANNKKNDSFTINRSSTGTDDHLLLPRSNAIPDNKGDDDRFLYVLNSDFILNNKNLEIDGTAKVTVYVKNQSVNIDGSVNIGSYNSNVTTGTISSHNLEIYVEGNQTIDINPGGGTVNIEALIHAPDSTLNITGSGEVNINGAVWVEDYNNTGGAVVNIRRDFTDTVVGTESSYKFYTTSANRTPRPLTSNPTNWVREEVQ